MFIILGLLSVAIWLQNLKPTFKLITSYQPTNPIVTDSTQSLCQPPKPLNKEIAILINLHQNDQVIPHLISQLKHLNAILYIYESGSTDNTKSLLHQWHLSLAKHNIRHHIETAPLSLQGMNRIEYLYRIRNKIKIKEQVDHVIFMNDIYCCASDIVTLVQQREQQQAHMVGGLDFDIKDNELGFYDSWVLRDMQGEPPLIRLKQLLKDKERSVLIANGEAVQVSCIWNGMVALDPQVLHHISFRRGLNREPGMKKAGECAGSEMTTFCLDMIKHGFDKMALIPSVQVVYNKDDFKRLKAQAPLSDPVGQIKYQSLPEKQLCQPYHDAWRLTGPNHDASYWEPLPSKMIG